MYNLLKGTYTFGSLKENILKMLGEFTYNGTSVSSAAGFLADADKKLVSALNICLRRVMLSMPLLKRTVSLQFFSGKAELPCDVYKPERVFVSGIGSISETSYRVCGGFLECSAVNDGGFAEFTYSVAPKPFTPDMPSGTVIELPDITADALCYLTASELCPAEYGELYSKLMYKYRDICLNAYNCESRENGRNSFFKRNIRRSFSKA